MRIVHIALLSHTGVNGPNIKSEQRQRSETAFVIEVTNKLLNT